MIGADGFVHHPHCLLLILSAEKLARYAEFMGCCVDKIADVDGNFEMFAVHGAFELYREAPNTTQEIADSHDGHWVLNGQ